MAYVNKLSLIMRNDVSRMELNHQTSESNQYYYLVCGVDWVHFACVGGKYNASHFDIWLFAGYSNYSYTICWLAISNRTKK